MTNERKDAAPILIVGAACLLFGFVMAQFKGSTYNLQDVLGNLSAPWVLVAFWSSTLTAKENVLRGALLGTVFVEVAFLGFYLGESLVFHIEILPALRDGLIWSSTGLIAGPVFGALGALEGRTKRGRFWFLMSCLFVLEPFLTTGYFELTADGIHIGHTELAAYAVEVALGLLGCVLVAHRFRLLKTAKGDGA